MRPDADHGTAPPPLHGFEERLLSRILADYEDPVAPARPSRSPRRHQSWGRAWAVMAAPALAAAVVAAVLVVSSGSGGGDRTSIRPVPGRDTAYVVDRVRARLARLAVAGEGRVLERLSTVGVGGPADRVISNADWAYIDPRAGTAYQRSVDRSASGAVLSINALVTTRVGNDLRTRATLIDPSRRAFDVVDDAPPGGTVTGTRSATALGITSTARQIDQALRRHRVVRRGTATVDGEATITLSVPPPAGLIKAGLPADTTITLYVDADTFRPVQAVRIIPRGPDSPGARSVSRWLPTTPRTIALARARIPAGYRRATGPVTDFWNATKPLFFIGY